MSTDDITKNPEPRQNAIQDALTDCRTRADATFDQLGESLDNIAAVSARFRRLVDSHQPAQSPTSRASLADALQAETFYLAQITAQLFCQTAALSATATCQERITLAVAFDRQGARS